jgi:hypothetical protein
MIQMIKEILATMKVAGLFAQMQIIRSSSLSPITKAIEIHKLSLKVDRVVKEMND